MYRILVAAIAALLLLSTHAYAAPVVSTTEASWLAASAGSTISTEDFNSSPLGSLAVGTTDIGLFDITIDANDGNNAISTASYTASPHFEGYIQTGSATAITFSFDAPITGFAGNLFYNTTTGDLLTVDVNGAILQFDNYLSLIGDGYFGVTDTNPFSSITFGVESLSSIGEFWVVDNFSIAQSAVPEPTSMALFGLGALGLAGMRRRRQRTVAQVV